MNEPTTHDPRDDYADAPTAPPAGGLDRLFAAESFAALSVLLFFGLCLLAFPATVLLAGLGVICCRDPDARHQATLLLAVAAVQAVLLSLVLMEGTGLRLRF